MNSKLLLPALLLSLVACSDSTAQPDAGNPAPDAGVDVDAGVEVVDCNVLQRLPCFEVVWVHGVARKMRFYDVDVRTNPPTQNFYVTAPQTATPQGVVPFQHDHTIAEDRGEFWHGYLVLCSERGLQEGTCVSTAAQGTPPLAATVFGQHLETVEAIEIARGAGAVTLLDTNAVLQGKVDPLLE